MTCIKKGYEGWKQNLDAKSADISALERIAHQLPAVPWADTWALGHFSILGDVVGTHERGTDSAILTPQFQEKVSAQSQNSSCYSCILSLSLKCPQPQNYHMWSLLLSSPLCTSLCESLEPVKGVGWVNESDQKLRTLRISMKGEESLLD